MIIKRNIFDDIYPYIDSMEAIIITGMRRTGKTTLLRYFYNQIQSSNKLFLDLENPVNRKYFEEDNYERIKKTWEFLGVGFDSRPYLFVDEIQFVKNLPSVVKYFVDHYQVKFFLTGSASFYLKNLFNESLSGRKLIFELFPLSFREFLTFKGESIQIPVEKGEMSRAQYQTLLPLYEEYLYFGGFPQVVLTERIEAKKSALEDIFTSFYQLEVLQMGDFRRNDALRDLMLLLLERVGYKLDIQKLSLALKVSRPTLYQYIAFLEGTYFFKGIRPFSKGRDNEIRKIPKIYACDTGLANHFSRITKGNLLENSVFQILQSQGELNYYQRKSGLELDFILDRKIGYEVKNTAHSSDVIRAEKIAHQIGLGKAYVLSLAYSEIDSIIYPFEL